MKILLLGANGQVGYQLQRSAANLGEIIACQREQADLSNSDALRNLLVEYKPELIINAAAYTAVDKAETEQDLALQINARAPQVLAEYAYQRDIPLVHYSTDYVFDGTKSSPWIETDKPNPLNIYGHSKLAGEQAIQESGCRHLIFRTSWVYDSRGHNFLNTMLRLAHTQQHLNIVEDQIGTPTWSRHIADVTAQILAQQAHSKTDFWQKHSGIYHLSASGESSWKKFAEAIFAQQQQAGYSVPSVNGIPTKAYPTPAQRPLNSCMDNSKLKSHFGIALPDWEESLKLTLLN